MAEATPAAIAAQLDVEERLMLFCVASGTDWTRAGIRGAVARNMIVKNLLAHERKTNELVLTARGRAVLAVLLSHAGIKFAPLD
jgi:hypothetical protein